MEDSSVNAFPSPDDVPPEVLVSEIGTGNPRAEEIFYRRYHKGLVIMLEARTRDRSRAEDLAQDALLTVLTRLRGKGIDHPERLNSFVHQTAKYQFIGWLRKSVNKTELMPSVDDHAEEKVSVEDEIDKDNLRSNVRQLIGELKVVRDREILYRFYVRDQAKLVICEALDLTPAHFDRVINRARNRFKQLLLQRMPS